MNLGLQEKVYIVSGGSEGIGAAITKTIIDEGGKVIIATRASEDITNAFISLANPTGDRLYAIYGDLQKSENCKAAIDFAINQFGKIDGVINNAGVNDKVGIEAGPTAFRDSIKLNLFHIYDLVHYALPHLKTSKGAIVNIASKVALTGQGNTSGYAAAKGGVLGLTREWAIDLLPYSIRVNAILPAEVMTPMYQQWLDTCEDPEGTKNKINSKIPFDNRMTSADEIAATVVFLLSDKAGHTTGQLLHVDGGYVHLDRMLS